MSSKPNSNRASSSQFPTINPTTQLVAKKVPNHQRKLTFLKNKLYNSIYELLIKAQTIQFETK